MITEITQQSELLVSHIRCGRFAASNHSFAAFIDLILKYSEEQQLTKDQELVQIFNIMQAAQGRNDWLFLADIIEYELQPRLTK